MRIFLTHKPGGAYGFITQGWMNALLNRGHDVRRYDGELSSWKDFDPDLYIGCSGHKQSIPQQSRTKLAIHVNPYGPVQIDGINETYENIKWVLKHKPDVVFGYGWHTDALLWSYWTTRHDIPWVPMPTAADATIFGKKFSIFKKYDLVYLGGRWPYKAKTIDSYLLPLLSKVYSFKVHGWGEWPQGICSGGLDDAEVSDFLSSGKIGPCISEIHSHHYGIDIPERAFKVALSKTLVVHDSVPQIKNMIPSAIVARDPEDFMELCLHYLSHDDEREQLIQQQFQEVLSAHTYHIRMHALLAALGFSEEAAGML